MPTKNYCFGAKPPRTQRENVEQQMLLAHRYRNQLVELELARRATAEATIRKLSPEYAALAGQVDAAEQRVENAYASIKAVSQKARKKIEPTDAEREEIRAAKTARAELYAQIKPLKTAAYKRLKELQEPAWIAAKEQAANAEGFDDWKPARQKQRIRQLALSDLERNGLDGGQAAYERDQKVARANCGCYWGTYLTVEDAASQFGQGTPPRFKAWDGHGTIAVQLMGGLSVEDALAGADTRLRLHLTNEEELATRGHSHNSRAVGTAQMRIGTEAEGRAPIWAEIPVTFHRPLPRQGVLRWAYLHRERVATKDCWKLRLTIEEPVIETPTLESLPVFVALHPGWRMREDEQLRVATWVGSDGRAGEILMSRERLQWDARPEQLASLRTLHFNAMLARILAWRDEFTGTLPDWLAAEFQTLAQWRSPGRLARLVLQWGDNRFEGDEPLWGFPVNHGERWQMCPKRLWGQAHGRERHDWHTEHCEVYLESWRQQEVHLYQWQENQRTRTIRARADLYRRTLKQLSHEYQRVILAKIDWAAMLSKEAADAELSQTNRQRHYGRLAAPGELTKFAREAFPGRFIEVSEQDLTRSCSHCGQIDEWDRRKLFHTCTRCAQRWDQDENACRNMLARAAVLRERQALLAINTEKGVTSDLVASAEPAMVASAPVARKHRRNRRAAQQLAAEPSQ